MSKEEAQDILVRIELQKATVYRHLFQKGVVIKFDQGDITLTEEVAWQVMECLQRLLDDGWRVSDDKAGDDRE